MASRAGARAVLLPLLRAAGMATDAGAAKAAGPRATAMRTKLQAAFAPTRLTIVDDSAKHAGHAGNPGGGPNAETHFKVEVVSAAFEGLPGGLVARHRAVYAALGDDFRAGLHALAIKAHTPAEAERAAAAARAASGGG